MGPETFNLWVIAEGIPCRLQQQFSIGVWAGTVGDCLVGCMFCHIGLQATTCMICQSYWKIYHWQSEHECGTCMMVLRAVRDVHSNTCHNRWTGRGGPTAWPPHSMPELNPMDFYLRRHLNTPAYSASVDSEEALHHGIVDACQTIHICPGIFEQIRRSTMRHGRGMH
jgi:hypothetical protein